MQRNPLKVYPKDPEITRNPTLTFFENKNQTKKTKKPIVIPEQNHRTTVGTTLLPLT